MGLESSTAGLFCTNSFLFYIYRVSIKSFPDYEHLLQENYLEYKHTFFFFQNVTQEVFLETNLSNGKKICLYSM